MSSPRTAHRLARILAMLPWVIANPGATVDEVCGRFGYTRAELLADLNLVFVCGLPGYGPGELMDAFVDEDEVVVDAADYFSRPVRLSATEALMLLAAGMAVLSSGAAPPPLATAVDKLQRVIAPDPEAVTVDLGDEPPGTQDLRDAAGAGQVMSITYTSLGSGETTDRDIEPWAVFSTLGNWYVSAFCRRAEAERLFRIDRIQDLQATGESFDPPESRPEPVVRYSPSVDDVTARIELGPEAAWVADYYPVEIVAAEGDRRTIDFSTRDASVAARLLIRLGPSARLVTGDEVAEATTDLRSRLLARYS